MRVWKIYLDIFIVCLFAPTISLLLLANATLKVDLEFTVSLQRTVSHHAWYPAITAITSSAAHSFRALVARLVGFVKPPTPIFPRPFGLPSSIIPKLSCVPSA